MQLHKYILFQNSVPGNNFQLHVNKISHVIVIYFPFSIADNSNNNFKLVRLFGIEAVAVVRLLWQREVTVLHLY